MMMPHNGGGILLLIVSCCAVYSIAAHIPSNKCTKETPCTNGGSCVKGKGVFECVCPQNFTGDLCQTKKGAVSKKSEIPELHRRGQCGAVQSPLSRRIINGIESNPAHWPWLLSIRIFTKHICGASLISEEWAITAAHCFYDPNTYQRISEKFMVVHAVGAEDKPESDRQFKIAELFIHYGYDQHSKRNDIALIKLDGKATNFATVCLPEVSGVPIVNGARCWAAGWGLVSGIHKIETLVLQSTTLPLQNSDRCPGTDPLYQLCAGGTGTSACMGDSGGPLYCPDNNDEWVLQGITSHGFTGFCLPTETSVYTRVSSYLKWIKDIMAGLGQPVGPGPVVGPIGPGPVVGPIGPGPVVGPIGPGPVVGPIGPGPVVGPIGPGPVVGPIGPGPVVGPIGPGPVVGPIGPGPVVGPFGPGPVVGPIGPGPVVGPIGPGPVVGPFGPGPVVGPIGPGPVVGPMVPGPIVGPMVPGPVVGPMVPGPIVGPMGPGPVVGPMFPGR